MKNINEYKKDEFYAQFYNSDLCKQIKKDFDILSWEKYYQRDFILTPRQIIGEIQKQSTVFSMVPLYYINYLLEKNPKEIYDIGCGWNIFKKYIPNIIGVGAEELNTEHFFGDIHDVWDSDFVYHHNEFYESIFSINALHFRPIDDLRKVVNEFASVIQKGGRGFLALNLARMVERAVDDKFFQIKFDFDKYIRNELKDVGFKYIVFDVDVTIYDESLDGNIRLVIEK